MRYAVTAVVKALSVIKMEFQLFFSLGDFPRPGFGIGLADKKQNQGFLPFILLLSTGQFHLLRLRA